MSVHRTYFSGLDASGKSAAHHHHRRYCKARAGKPAAGFFICNRCYPGESFKLSNLLHRIFRNLLTVRKTFDTSGKSPADYHHRANRAEPGRRNPPRAFSIEIFQSDGGRLSRRPNSQRPSPEASRARRRPNLHQPARANVPACGVAKVTAASGPCSKDTVRARNDRTPVIMPRILFPERRR